jgi:hypothetical protein
MISHWVPLGPSCFPIGSISGSPLGPIGSHWVPLGPTFYARPGRGRPRVYIVSALKTTWGHLWVHGSVWLCLIFFWTQWETNWTQWEPNWTQWEPNWTQWEPNWTQWDPEVDPMGKHDGPNGTQKWTQWENTMDPMGNNLDPMGKLRLLLFLCLTFLFFSTKALTCLWVYMSVLWFVACFFVSFSFACFVLLVFLYLFCFALLVLLHLLCFACLLSR